MKTLLNVFNSEVSTGQHNKTGNKAERILLNLLKVFFVLMIFIQLALTQPMVRDFLHICDVLTGIPLGKEEYLYSRGEIGLQLSEYSRNKNIKILINGDEVGDFTKNTVVLTVKDGDVLEIDGTEAESDTRVLVVHKSKNIVNESLLRSYMMKSKVTGITKVKIK